jgi:hypothetical protein
MGKHDKKDENFTYITPIPDLYVSNANRHPAKENVDIIDASIRKYPIPTPEVTE